MHLILFCHPLTHYSRAEIDAIEDIMDEKNEHCDCSKEEKGYEHDDDCRHFNFDFDKSLAFQFYRCHYRAINLFKSEMRSEAWKWHLKYFHVWQQFCIKVEHQISEVFEILGIPQDIENICFQYLKQTVGIGLI
jgi:hypothetical protein